MKDFRQERVELLLDQKCRLKLRQESLLPQPNHNLNLLHITSTKPPASFLGIGYFFQLFSFRLALGATFPLKVPSVPLRLKGYHDFISVHWSRH